MANVLEIVVEAQDNASRVLTGIDRSLGNYHLSLKRIGIAAAAMGAAITGALVLSVKTWAKAGDEIAKLSQKTGFSTEALSELRYAAEQSGASLDTITTGIRTMSSVLVDAGYGLETAERPFKALNLNVASLRKLEPEKQFRRIALALADVKDFTLKSALAQDIFGRSGLDLLPILANGAEGLESMSKEARDLGLVFSPESAGKAEEFNNSITRLTGGVRGLQFATADALSPSLTKLIDQVTAAIKSFGDWAEKNPALTTTLVNLAAWAGACLVVLGGMNIAAKALAPVIAFLSTPVGIVIAALMELVAIGFVVKAHWDSVWLDITRAFTVSVNFLISLAENFVNFWIGAINKVIGLLNKFSLTLPSWMGGGTLGVNLSPLGGVSLPRMNVPLSREEWLNRSNAMFGERIPGYAEQWGPGASVVYVNVQGSIMSDYELQEYIRQALLDAQRRNVSTGLVAP